MSIYYTVNLDCTNILGTLNYWCRWLQGGRFVPSSEVAEKWPRLLLDFFEAKIRFECPVGPSTYKFQSKGARREAPYFVGPQMGEY